MSKSTQQEQLVITMVLDGDAEAYRQLVERYLTGLVHHLYNLVGDSAGAEDIAQEAFIVAYQKLGQYNPNFAFSTWLYRIADNLAYSHLRQRNEFITNDKFFDDLADETPSIADQLDKESQKLSVRQAIHRLDPRYRQVIVLYYWDNFSYEEIAETLQRPIGTVRTWLSRAKQQLRKELYGTAGKEASRS